MVDAQGPSDHFMGVLAKGPLAIMKGVADACGTVELAEVEVVKSFNVRADRTLDVSGHYIKG